MKMPRTVLLTWSSPGGRYAGGAAIRRLLSCMPREALRWCGFHAGASGSDLPDYEAFPTWHLHWRLRGSSLEYRLADGVQARLIAERMWRRLKPFDPQVLWVFPEVVALPVALALQRRSGLPLHATVHDAPETAAYAGIPASCMSAYLRRFGQLMRVARSVDAVSQPLLDHLRQHHQLPVDRRGLVIPPCVAGELLVSGAPRAWRDRPERRIGLCGSLRISGAQWTAFLSSLARLTSPVVIESFTPREDLPPVPLPANVTIRTRPYVNTEGDLVNALVAAELDAAYLGLWREPDRRLFGQTSLSSKLVAYAAARLPVLVDAEADSVVATLVSHYGAGICLPADPSLAAAAMQRLFSDATAWTQATRGAQRLAVEALDLDRNAGLLKAQLCALAPC